MADSLVLPQVRSLSNPPSDGITALQYLDSSRLASTSWDGSVRLHDTAADKLLFSQPLDSGPLFSFANVDSLLIAGGMDGSIRKVDMETSKSILVGKHKSSTSTETDSTTATNKVSCSCLVSLGSSQVASAGWHKQFHVWDIRQQSPALTIDLPGKAFSMDVDNNVAVVATSGRRLCFIDVRQETILLDRESSLKYQTRCVKFFPNGNAIALGCIEGRAAVEYLQDLGRESTSKNFAFKCHRDGDMLYPVNAIDFHPGYGTFATGGCDGTVVMWDGLNKKKLTSLPKLPTSVAALAFNHDGSELAIASSYTFEDGEREHPKDEIYIRTMLDSECQPKKKS